MNREQKRAFVKNAHRKGMSKKQAENFLRIADSTDTSHTPSQIVKTGDKVMLNVEALKSKKNYDIMNPEYRKFVEASEGIEFTAVQEGNKLIHLEEEPKWLFWCGDMTVVSSADTDNQSRE